MISARYGSHALAVGARSGRTAPPATTTSGVAESVDTAPVVAGFGGGHCVGRLPAEGEGAEGNGRGRVLFVRHTLPGEQVMVRVTDDSHDKFWRADVLPSNSAKRRFAVRADSRISSEGETLARNSIN